MIQDEGGRKMAEKALYDLAEAGRIEASIKVIVSKEPFKDVLKEESGDATAVFLGLQCPEEGKELEVYRTYSSYLEFLPTTLLVHSVEEVDLLA